ncbi:MAG: (Fe-S)-binding protein [Planctomycetota bacterium]
METALFVTCLGDTFYPEAVRSTRRVLERLGHRISCPPDQTCCGQPMFNAGYFDQARQVARHFIEVFSRTEGPIVTPSSSCAAMIREHYPRLFRDDESELEKARAIGKRTFEFSEFLVREQKVDLRKERARFKASVTYHHSCHFRMLGVRTEPVDLILQIEGLEFIPLNKMDQCCGFGGTFSMHYPHVSREMVADKVRCILETHAEWLVFADPGCAMNITGYANRIGLPIKAMHLAELIDKALGGEG